MSLYTAIHAAAVANPEELFEIWCRVEELERDGTVEEWKRAIFGVMTEKGLKPEDVLGALVEDPSLLDS
jgi:hypothetical protein